MLKREQGTTYGEISWNGLTPFNWTRKVKCYIQIERDAELGIENVDSNNQVKFASFDPPEDEEEEEVRA